MEVNIVGTSVGTGDGNDIIQEGTWHHVAVTRASGTVKIWVDGVEKASGSAAGDVTGTTFITGYYDGLYTYQGFMSNFRYRKGTAHYTTTFTVPTKPLERTSDTELIFAQSPHNPSDGFSSAIHGGTTDIMQVIGNVTANASSPTQLSDTSAVGVVYDGPIKHNTQGYMYFPTGRTEERGRGRGLIMGYYIAPANYNTCEFITIQSLGNSQDFGDMSQASRGHFSFGSSTRAIRGGGYVAPANVNVIEFFTIATQSNATDFGDITNQSHLGSYAPISNETRGIFAGGYSYPATFNNIDFVTIASTGNSQDFGGLTTLRADGNRSQVNSSTRGLIGGGYISPTGTNNIEFVTIATTGNSQDFGDLTQGRGNFTGLCSSTRGVFAGGTNPANNIIDFVTIASAGNATDFGDMIDANSGAMSSTSNNIRGVIVGGDQQPENYYVNTMQFVTIATTGNAQDFGDALTAKSYMGMTSDSHGGLS